ncbi:MAG: DUF1599 domain-containing protein [Syntrophales bacterium]
MSIKTERDYDGNIADCKQLFLNKVSDYGPSWILFRLPSLTDQMLIKAKRIRRLEELKGKSMIPESIDVEYRGILNYCVMALINLWFPGKIPLSDSCLAGTIVLEPSVLKDLYDQVIRKTKELMYRKNHDYGEAWKEMRITSITDQILVKIYRIKAIEEHKKKLLASEDIDAQYSDILNYCVFALIKLKA